MQLSKPANVLKIHYAQHWIQSDRSKRDGRYCKYAERYVHNVAERAAQGEVVSTRLEMDEQEEWVSHRF